jgi:hypothetical protein
MEALLVDENKVATPFIQDVAEDVSYTHILCDFEIDSVLLERLLGHPPIQGSHGSPPGRLHERGKGALIDVDVNRLIAHFLCVIKDGRVLIGLKGVVGKCIVTSKEIGVAEVGKSTGGDTNAKIPEESPSFKGLKERRGGTGVTVQAEITAADRLVDDIDNAVKWPSGDVKGWQGVSRSTILTVMFKPVMKGSTNERGQRIEMEVPFRNVEE